MLLYPLPLLLLLTPFIPATTINQNNYSPAIFISITPSSSPSQPQPQPSTILPPSPSTTTDPFAPGGRPPSCPLDHLSCETIGEPSWCCATNQNCAFDDGGDVACCPMGDFCKGTISHGSGSGGDGAAGAGVGDGGATQGVGAVATMGVTPGEVPASGGIIIVNAGTVGDRGLEVGTMLAGLILGSWAFWI